MESREALKNLQFSFPPRQQLVRLSKENSERIGQLRNLQNQRDRNRYKRALEAAKQNENLYCYAKQRPNLE